MRRALVLAVLALVLASPAGAQQKGRLSVPGGVALRGAQTAEPQAASPVEAASAAFAAAQLTSVAPSAPRVEASQCRLACAQEYYFCLAGDGTDDCAPHWGQCRAGCDAPGRVADLASNSPR